MYDATTAGYRPTVTILASAVGFVLLIACVNVASLQLARGATRQQELAIRASIGAGRGRLVRQLLTESVVLALAGAATGVLVAWSTLHALVANIPISLSSDAPVELNWRVLGFTLALAIVSGVLFGLMPAFRLSRVQVGDVLARVPRGHGTALPRRLSQTLVAIEIALAVVLLAGGGLMIRSFAKLTATDLGFRPADFLTLEVEPMDPNPAGYMTYYPALLERIRALPNVAAAGAISDLPLSGSLSMGTIGVPGQPPPNDKQGVNLRQVMPGYFEAIGLPLRAGRLPRDSDSTGSPVVVINDQAAQQLFPGVSPLGHLLEVAKQAREIVGVVGNVRHLGPETPPVSEVYLLYLQGYTQTTLAGQSEGKALTIVVRPSVDTPALAPALRQAALDVGQPVIVRRIRHGEEWFDASVTTPRQRTVLLGLLGALGLLLAVVGVFGVTSYMVARRTQEIGVRMAFGAQSADVVWTMVRDSALPIGLGIVAGLIGAAMATRVISAFLFETTARDPVTFAAVALGLGIAGCLAAWLPARRAAHVDPVTALRAD
jgi:putative ABC transport system permease protein